MFPEITIMHCFVPIYCQKGTKNIQLSNASRNYKDRLLYWNLLIKTVLKSFDFQMLPEITIIHCFITIYCKNDTKNI